MDALKFYLFIGDHALIDLGCIGHFNPKLITVKSKSRELLSIDSPAVPITGSASATARTSKRGAKMVIGRNHIPSSVDNLHVDLHVQMSDNRYKYGGGTSALGHYGGHGHVGHGGRSAMSRRGGSLGPPRAMRDASGQLIIDHDEENLSDKEMYARNVPAIGRFDRSESNCILRR